MLKKMCMWYAEHVEDIDGASGLEAAVTDGGTAAALVELFTRKQVGWLLYSNSAITLTHSGMNASGFLYDLRNTE